MGRVAGLGLGFREYLFILGFYNTKKSFEGLEPRNANMQGSFPRGTTGNGVPTFPHLFWPWERRSHTYLW